MQAEILAILIPVDSHVRRHIAARSAIVGTRTESGTWIVDFAGNINNASNLETFEDRLQSAAGRHAARYPTVARMSLEAADIKVVGTARHSEALKGWIVAGISDPEALAAWLGDEALPRIGGSLQAWQRAAGLLMSRGGAARISTMAAKRGLDIASAAYRVIEETETGLVAP